MKETSSKPEAQASLAPARCSTAPAFGSWMSEAKTRIGEWGIAVPTNTRFYKELYLKTYGVAPVLPNTRI